jgi:hypothetical protein
VEIRKELKFCFGEVLPYQNPCWHHSCAPKHRVLARAMNSGQDEYPHMQSSGWRRDFQAVVEHQHILEVPDRQTQVPRSFSYQVWCRNRWKLQAKGRIGLRGESFWTSGARTVCGVYNLFQVGFFEISSDKPDRKVSYRRLITTCLLK